MLAHELLTQLLMVACV